MEEKQFLFDEGYKEIMMALFALGATGYEAKYISDNMQKMPEPQKQKIEQQVQQMSAAKKVKPTLSFDKALDKLMNMYKIPEKTPPIENTHKEQPIEKSLSDELVAFVKKHENFSPAPFWDRKQYSIGYGTKAEPGDTEITEEEAARRLLPILSHHKKKVLEAKNMWGYDWTPKQIDALTSFRFNIGSLGELTNNGTRSNKEIANSLIKYDKAKDKKGNIVTLPGLTTRRKAELQLFLSKK